MDRHQPQQYFELIEERPITSSGIDNRGPRSVLAPTEEMRKAKAWLEVIKRPPEPDEQLLAIHGWLSPTGELYACGWEKHNDLTRALGFQHESEIEEAGFCKLSQLNWLVQARYCDQSLTAAQWTTIERWYARNGFPEEHFLRLSGPV